MSTPSSVLVVGACLAAGQLVCQNGVPVNTCQAGTPAARIVAGYLDDAGVVRITSYNVCYTKLLRF